MEVTYNDFNEYVSIQVWYRNRNRHALVIGNAEFKLDIICKTNENSWIELHHEGRLKGRFNIKTEWKPTVLELTIETILNWLGIDLGTTHTAAAYSKKGISNRIAGVNVDMIPINLENGRQIVPSVVRF